MTITYGNRTLSDSTKAWATNLWINGTVIDAIGNIACVDSNNATTLTLRTPQTVTTLDGSAAATATTIPVTSTTGLYPHMRIQLEKVSDSTKAEICEIASVSPGVSITVKRGITNSYVAGDLVSIGKSILQPEYLGTATWASLVATDSAAKWIENQWKGYKLLSTNNVLANVVSNTTTTLTIDAGAPTNGAYSVAKNFTTGATFADRQPHLSYSVHSGDPTFTFEPTLDLEVSGTIYDPFNRLWSGLGVNLIGAWNLTDVLLYVTTSVTQHLGRATTFSGVTFDLDATVVAPTTNQFAGMFLNPNQNQTKLIEIVSNSTTQLTLAQSIDDLVIPGQAYYVLKPRDASRFRRVSERLGPPGREFANSEIDAHILFA